MTVVGHRTCASDYIQYCNVNGGQNFAVTPTTTVWVTVVRLPKLYRNTSYPCYSQNTQRVPLMTEESISLLRNQLQSSIRISKIKRNIEIIRP